MALKCGNGEKGVSMLSNADSRMGGKLAKEVSEECQTIH